MKPCDTHAEALPCTSPFDEGLCLGGIVWKRGNMQQAQQRADRGHDCPWVETIRRWWKRKELRGTK